LEQVEAAITLNADKDNYKEGIGRFRFRRELLIERALVSGSDRRNQGGLGASEVAMSEVVRIKLESTLRPRV
jgi:hypothetical protein